MQVGRTVVCSVSTVTHRCTMLCCALLCNSSTGCSLQAGERVTCSDDKCVIQVGKTFACRLYHDHQLQLWKKLTADHKEKHGREEATAMISAQQACVKALHYHTGKEVTAWQLLLSDLILCYLLPASSPALFWPPPLPPPFAYSPLPVPSFAYHHCQPITFHRNEDV